ncbi:MAG: YfhO family protein [Candidatus Peribacteraceae bacterium]|nr:YfhO family protein [Candidatus Peribacteraceae bacterium]
MGYTIVESQYHLHPYLYAQPLTYWYNFASTIYTTILHSAIIFSIIICTITILYKQTNKKGGAEKLIIAIIFIDLFIFASPYIVTSPVPAAPDYIDLLDSRTLSISALPQHIAYPNIQLIDGYDANYLTSYQEFIWQLSNDTPTKQLFLTIPPINNLNILQMLNTSHIITTIPITTPGLTEIYNQNNTIIYKLNNILPRAYFMSNVTFQNGSIYFTLPNEYQEAHITFTSPNEVHMTINTTKPGFLIHSNTHYPGWKAYDNNQSTQIYTANNALQSIYLTAGHRNISFQYDPDSYSIGKLISIISFLIICILLIYYHRNV